MINLSFLFYLLSTSFGIFLQASGSKHCQQKLAIHGYAEVVEIVRSWRKTMFVCVRCKKWRYFPTTPRGRFIKIGYFVPRYSALLTWLESNFQELHLHLEENITDGFLCNAAPSSNTDDKTSTLYGGNRCHSSPKNSQKVGEQRAPGWGRRAFHSVGVTKKKRHWFE